MAAMYNKLVHSATDFLDGRRTKILRLSGMTIAEKLKALREALPAIEGQPVGVRAIAAAMGHPDVPNAYGYYESSAFKRKTLPLEKAREIAAAFAKLGGRQEDILALTALNPDEIEAQPSRVADPAPRTVMLAVQMPSEDELTDMFVGLLEAADRPDLAGELAPRLARLLPDGLGRARVGRKARPKAVLNTPGVTPPRPAKERPERQ